MSNHANRIAYFLFLIISLK